MPFLNVDKKIWIINDLEIPVIEDVPMKDLKWFKTKMVEAEDLAEQGKSGTKTEIEFETNWFDKVCKVGLGKSLEEIEDTNISQPKFRILMAEVYTFLSSYGTVEEAKLSGLYDQEIQKKESNHIKTTQNSKS
jgi:hypothetical protein